MGFEVKIITFLQSGANDVWTAFFKTVSLFGDWVGMVIVFALFLFLVGRKYAFTFLFTYISGFAVGHIIKAIVERDRPYQTFGEIQGLSTVFGSSMPSGHAISSIIIAIFAVFLVYKLTKNKFFRIAMTVTMAMFVFIVCLSRMYLGLHYLTDILAGLSIGAIVSTIGLFIFNRSFRKTKEVKDD